MASRSGSNGTVVGLVVFVLATVGLLVTSIVLWSKYDEARKAADSARATKLESDRKADDAATRLGQAMAVFVGRTDASVEELRRELGAGENDIIKTMLEKARSDATKYRKDLAAAEEATAKARADLEVAIRRVDDAKLTYDAALAEKQPEFAEREQALASTQEALDGLKQQLVEARDEVESSGRAREEELQSKLNAIADEKVALESRAADLQHQVDRIRVQPKNAAAVVDGRVISSNTQGRVYIDLGRKQRVRPGMTFEVYSDAVTAGVDPKTGAIRPGKASIEILSVEDTSSTARVIRQQPGASPPVAEDVLVNAIYSPDYVYRFFVYGEFDTDGDGRTSAEERAFVMQRIKDWGGTVTEGEQLPGDVDFVVVGVEPSEPRETLSDASNEEIEAVSQQRERRRNYLAIVERASDARVPLLNWNRMRTLTGDAER